VPHEPRDTAAGWFHVYTHCVWAVPAYFHDDLDRVAFLRILARVTSRFGWTCIGFCLMTSHYHLIVDVEDGVLPRALHRLNQSYSRGHNRRYALRGHAQHRRYGSRRLDGEAGLLSAFKYVMLNPVEAGLCKRPEQWRWSTYGDTVGPEQRFSFVDATAVLECFPRASDPQAALRRYVEKP
jgi:REP element-mobilizing transposase RayT